MGPGPIFLRAVETTEVLAVKHDKGLCFSDNKWYIEQSFPELIRLVSRIL